MPRSLRLPTGLAATAAVLALAALAAPASASAAGWTCDASAVRATVLTAPAIEPVTANAGADACGTATGGLSTTPPALPPALALGALDAETSLANPTGPAAEQTARAAGGVAAVRVSALPSLPVTLPAPDLSDYADVRIPGTPVHVDLRPALEALIAPRDLPAADLLDVDAARAQASARCQDGAPRLTGSSSLAGVTVMGIPVGTDRAVTRSVTLIDSQSIDPSDADLTAIAGVPQAAQAALQTLLDGLPDVEVPATVARIHLVPGERVRTGVRLTQRALHATVAIAGRRIADVIAGEATVGSRDVACGGVADLALQCSSRRVVLIDVKIRKHHVRLRGAADRRYAGRRVRIRSTWNGRTVARPRLGRGGLFHARAKLPPRRLRHTSRARYVAVIHHQHSLRLKLVRRMHVAHTRSHGRHVTITGRVVRPLARPRRAIAVKRRVSCGRWKVVKHVRPHRSGRFEVRVKAPPDGQAAAYRLSTKVRQSPSWSKLFPTFTLPRYVDRA